MDLCTHEGRTGLMGNQKRDVKKYFFMFPNAVFELGLHVYELAIYAYLLRIEDRRTWQCVVSYPTIADKLGISVNTVAKYVGLTQWIFPDPLRPERPVSPGSAYRRLKAILEETGLPDLRFHDLRHTFATHALANGVDAKTLAGIPGHTKASFTVDTYQDSVHHHRPCLQCHDAKCLRPCDR